MAFITRLSVICPSCGSQFEAGIPLTVDMEKERDLLKRWKSGDLHLLPCPHCGHRFPVEAPLLLISKSLLIFSPASRGSFRYAADQAAFLLQQLGEERRAVWIVDREELSRWPIEGMDPKGILPKLKAASAQPQQPPEGTPEARERARVLMEALRTLIEENHPSRLYEAIQRIREQGLEKEVLFLLQGLESNPDLPEFLQRWIADRIRLLSQEGELPFLATFLTNPLHWAHIPQFLEEELRAGILSALQERYGEAPQRALGFFDRLYVGEERRSRYREDLWWDLPILLLLKRWREDVDRLLDLKTRDRGIRDRGILLPRWADEDWEWEDVGWKVLWDLLMKRWREEFRRLGYRLLEDKGTLRRLFFINAALWKRGRVLFEPVARNLRVLSHALAADVFPHTFALVSVSSGPLVPGWVCMVCPSQECNYAERLPVAGMYRVCPTHHCELRPDFQRREC